MNTALIYLPWGTFDIKFSTLMNGVNGGDNQFASAINGTVTFAEATMYKTIFAISDVTDETVKVCCDHAMQKLADYVDGMDWYKKLGYERLPLITKEHLRILCQPQCLKGFNWIGLTYYSAFGALHEDSCYTFRGIINMPGGYQDYLYTKK